MIDGIFVVVVCIMLSCGEGVWGYVLFVDV